MCLRRLAGKMCRWWMSKGEKGKKWKMRSADKQVGLHGFEKKPGGPGTSGSWQGVRGGAPNVNPNPCGPRPHKEARNVRAERGRADRAARFREKAGRSRNLRFLAGLGKSRQATRLSGAAFLRKARRQGEGVLEVRRAKVDNALREKASRAGVEVAAISPGRSP